MSRHDGRVDRVPERRAGAFELAPEFFYLGRPMVYGGVQVLPSGLGNVGASVEQGQRHGR